MKFIYKTHLKVSGTREVIRVQISIKPSELFSKIEQETTINIDHGSDVFHIYSTQSTGIRWIYHQRDKAAESPTFDTKEDENGEEFCFAAKGKFPLGLLTLKGTARKNDRVSEVFNY